MRVLKTALVVSLVTVALSAQSGRKQIVPPAPGQGYSQAISVGGFVYVSGMMATDVTGDITAQTRQIFEQLQGVLKQAGSSVDHIVNAFVTLEQAGDVEAFDEVYRAQFKSAFPARTVYIGNMVRPGALVEMWVTAVPDGNPRRAIAPVGWMNPSGPYSYAIQSGDTLFLSGMVSANMTDLTRVGGDTEAQVKRAMGNAIELLKSGGMTLDNTVSAHVAITHRNAEFAIMNTTYGSYWDIKDPKARGAVPGRPFRATVGLDNLPGFDFQVSFVAVKGSTPREVVIPPNPDGTPGQLGALPFSPAIRVGNRIWISGTTGGTVQPIRAHLKENIARLERVLEAGGFSYSDIVLVEVWLTNVSHYEVMDEVFREIFPTNPPVRKVVGVDALGGTAVTEIAYVAVK
jgi:2-iminobutanoate/2-iminopropanoate deaminase